MLSVSPARAASQQGPRRGKVGQVRPRAQGRLLPSTTLTPAGPEPRPALANHPLVCGTWRTWRGHSSSPAASVTRSLWTS